MRTFTWRGRAILFFLASVFVSAALSFHANTYGFIPAILEVGLSVTAGFLIFLGVCA